MRDEKGRWLKGHTANPGGRPKGLAAEIRRRVGEDGCELIGAALSIMRNPEASDRDRLAAVAWLADHGFGKAVSPIDLNAHVSGTLGIEDEAAAEARLDRLSPEDRETYLKLLERLEHADGEGSGGPAPTPGA